jgi:hypothetical protein
LRTYIYTILFWVLVGMLVYSLAPADAACFGCAEVPCFRGGPPCEGMCSCQWEDEISGFCG